MLQASDEVVIRHRGRVRDENGKLTPETQATLPTIAIAPRGGTETDAVDRDGETIVCTVYLPLGTDILNSDELTVRGERFRIIVNDWRLSGFGGFEVLCARGQG